MGERNYYKNQFDYSYTQESRPQISNLFDMGPSQYSGVSLNTQIQTNYSGSRGSYYDQAHHSNIVSESGEVLGYRRDPPPPSYDQYPNDRQLSYGERIKNYSSAPWSHDSNEEFGRKEQLSQNKSFANLFDLSGNPEFPQKNSDLSNNRCNFSKKSNSALDSYRNSKDCPLDQSYQKFTPRFDDQSQQSSYKHVPSDNCFRQDNYQSGDWEDDEMKPESTQEEDDEQLSHFEDDFDGVDKDHEENIIMSGEDNQFYPDPSLVEKYKYYPDPALVEKYKYYPPTAIVMNQIFKNLVIYFYCKEKNILERNPFVIICESFRRGGFCTLDVEDGYSVTIKFRKFCTLRYQGMMLMRGVGDSNNLKEPRVRAGVDLINQLAMSCYTLKAKPEYYKAFQEMLRKKEVPGVYRFVPREEVPDLEKGRQFLERVRRENSDVEYIFNFENCVSLKGWATKHYYECRLINANYLGVCRRRSPQYWRDKILASGSMETARYTLIPPQGFGNLLIENFNVKDYVPHLRNQPLIPCSIKVKYGPPGVGPEIKIAVPPWEKFSRPKKADKKVRAIVNALQEGYSLDRLKKFKYLSKKKKAKLRKQFAQDGLIPT